MSIERFGSGIPRVTIPRTENPSLSGGTVHGAARWLTKQEVQAAGFLEAARRDASGNIVDCGILFGQGSAGYLFYKGDGNSLIVAPPGAGKGVGFVIPNLVFYPGSMIVIDPKGENAAQTAKHRRDVLKHDVFVLDPSGVSGLPSANYNPLQWLEAANAEDFMSEVRVFAEAVIESGFGKETYWTNSARSLFVGLVCYLAAHNPDRLNLNEIYRLTRLPFNEWKQLWELMQQSNCAVPELRQWVRDYGAWYLSQHPDHQMYHLGTVQEATSWMGNLGAARVMGKSDFDMRDLKRKPITIYLCVHPTQLVAYRGWFRLIVSQAIMSVFQNIGRPQHPVLFMLDEFARAVGQLSIIDNALPQMRGYGGRFAFVLQTIGQLQEMYPKGWTTFEETSGVCVYLQSRGETAEHVSKRLGQTTVTVPATGGFSQTGRPLLYPQEVSQLDRLDEIVFVEGKPPMLCKRVTSHSDPNFNQHLSKNNMEQRALPSSANAPKSLIQQVREATGNRAAPPTITPEQKADLTRLNNGGWSDAPPVSTASKSADEREAALLSSLSKRCGKRVIRNDAGVYGYYNETQKFIELE